MLCNACATESRLVARRQVLFVRGPLRPGTRRSEVVGLLLRELGELHGDFSKCERAIFSEGK